MVYDLTKSISCNNWAEWPSCALHVRWMGRKRDCSWSTIWWKLHLLHNTLFCGVAHFWLTIFDKQNCRFCRERKSTNRYWDAANQLFGVLYGLGKSLFRIYVKIMPARKLQSINTAIEQWLITFSFSNWMGKCEFQHDAAICHKSRASIDILKETSISV